jgi:uncharacterized membrane protein
MSQLATATALVVIGSGTFLVGAAIAVPAVFRLGDVRERLHLLESRRRQWRAGQPLYALGPLIVDVGVGVLALAGDSTGRGWLAASFLLLLLGSLCWTVSVYLRFRHVREFALGQLPWWPFATYVCLTLAGLAALGVGLAIGDFSAWTAWLTLTATVAFTVGFVRYRDIPPFVFYLLLPAVSLGWS